MAGDRVALVLVAGAAGPGSAAALFPGTRLETLERDDLRPRAPFEGRLFELLGVRPRGSLVGLVVPVVPVRPAGARAPDPGDLVPIADHVNLELRGPLTGRWPAGVPRVFPSLTCIYQPGLVRPPEGARVYSSGVVAAGVADVRRLSAFEVRAVRDGGWPVVSDSLVPVTIVAAFYGLRLAACGVAQAPRFERE